eukprot:6207422-Pleurochrysis_carterae.AAC.5
MDTQTQASKDWQTNEDREAQDVHQQVRTRLYEKKGEATCTAKSAAKTAAKIMSIPTGKSKGIGT